MTKRTFILSILLILCWLDLFGQSGLKFSVLEHDFGAIPENGGAVTHIFEGENRGERPEVILSVTATCGCTTPQYSRKPILPGEKFTVEVRYDPQGRPGPFDKPLVIYDASRRAVAELRVRGTVTPRERTVEERYPVVVAEGVRLTNNFLMMGNRPQGEPHTIRIGIVNTATQPRRLTFMNRESCGFLRLEIPEHLAAGEETELLLTLQIPESSGRYGTIRDRFELVVDGRPTGIPFTVEALVVDNPASVIGEWGSSRALTDTQTVKLGEQRIDNGWRSAGFELRNAGDAELVVRAVECTSGIASSLKPGDRVAAGRALRVKALLDTGAFDYGVRVGCITIVTNDPENPVRRVRVSAILIE